MTLRFAGGASLSLATLGLLVLAASCSSEPDGTATAAVSLASPSAGDGRARRRPLLADGLPAGMKRYRPAGAKQITSAHCQSPQLTYYGGPILQNPVIVPVFWNSNVNPATIAGKPQFYADVTQSSYWSWLREYDTAGLAGGSNQAILPGTATAGVVLTPLLCPASMTATCALTDDDLRAELTRQIGLDTLPAPVTDCSGNSRTIYMIDLPSNVTLTGPEGTGASCQDFCAYHNTGTYGPNDVPLIYAALMDYFVGPCSAGCGGGTDPFDNETSAASHELAEAATDTDVGLLPDSAPAIEAPVGWYDENNMCGEIADICDTGASDATITVGGRTHVVQLLWSNQQNDCVSSGPAVTLCSGTTVTGCHPCSCGDSGNGCTGATPVCETDSTNVLFGACEQCTEKSGTCATCQQSTTPAQDDVCVGCTPITACPSGDDCGVVPNGCGGNFVCGTCTAPQTCGTGSPGTPNVCGCVPTVTACPAGDDCGSVPDGCGNMVPCGTCTAPRTCGGGTPTNPNQCGCTPLTSCEAVQNCGTTSDGCGGTLTCGPACTAPQTCGGSGTPNICGCTPLSVCPATAVCGALADRCGGMLMCGTCGGGQFCTGNACVVATTSMSGGEGAGGSEATSSGAGGGGTSTGAVAGKSGCSCETAGDRGDGSGMGLSALGVLALAGVVRPRRQRRAKPTRTTSSGA
jgi:MYXO-CTERM domain-containing protein